MDREFSSSRKGTRRNRNEARDERTHLPPLLLDLLQHALHIRELSLVPIKVPVLLRILYIQPGHIQRESFPVGIEPPVHVQHVLLIEVVPSALVVAQRPVSGESRRADEGGELFEERVRGGGGSGEEEEVEDTGFGDPVGRDPVRGGGRRGDVDPGFGGGEVEDG